MADYIVRATAAGAAIRAFAITSRDLVETARQDHNTSPIMTAALGRLLSGGAMMGVMMKGEKDLLTMPDPGQRSGQRTYRYRRCQMVMSRAMPTIRRCDASAKCKRKVRCRWCTWHLVF